MIGPHEGILTHPWIIMGNKQITHKAYNEAKMRTQHIQHAEILGDPLVVKHHLWKAHDHGTHLLVESIPKALCNSSVT